jgi:hypothetical protein
VFFTIALLCLVPAALWNLNAGHDTALMARLDAGFRAEAQTAHYLGIACLAIILVALTTIWTGYVNRTRAAWLVMFIVVWLWAFPLFILPYLSALTHGRIVLPFSDAFHEAISMPGTPRSVMESLLIFLLMVIALILPIKAFFLRLEVGQTSADG